MPLADCRSSIALRLRDLARTDRTSARDRRVSAMSDRQNRSSTRTIPGRAHRVATHSETRPTTATRLTRVRSPAHVQPRPVSPTVQDFPLPLSAYPPPRPDHCRNARRSHRARSIQRHRHRDFPARDSAYLRGVEFPPPGRSGSSTAMTSGGGARAIATAAERSPPRFCTFSARSRWSLVCGRSSCSRRSRSLCGWETATALRQRHGHLHRAALCRRDHGAGFDAADHHVRRSAMRRVAALGRCHAGGVVALHPVDRPVLGSFITEPAAMTICALLLARQFYDLQPSMRSEIRHAGPVVRQRLDRRHADPLRCATGADGRAPVGMGHAVHARPLRLAIGRSRFSWPTSSTTSCFSAELAALARDQPCRISTA